MGSLRVIAIILIDESLSLEIGVANLNGLSSHSHCKRSPATLRSTAWLLLFVPAWGCGGIFALTGGPTPPPPNAKGSLVLTPQGSCVTPSGTQQFTATPSNLSGSGVDWYVDSVKNGNSTVGTISADGLYGAPSSTGSHRVQTVSQSDNTVTAAGTIAVTMQPAFAVSPGTATVAAARQQAFGGETCGIPNNNVAWSVDNVPGGNPTVGTVDNAGVYTAPATAGTHTIRATDATLNQSSDAAVTVASSISIDFGFRSNTKHPIPAGILGVNHVDWLPDHSTIALIPQAGFTLSRTYANVPTVFATRKPDWSKIDPKISELRAAGLHVLLQLAYTPPWLQPTPNPCGSGNTTAPPASATEWAQLARSFVAHMDATFPGVVTEYEIWNEPDAGGLCGASTKLNEPIKLNEYLAIYAAAAPLMKQQAAADGLKIRIGGPAISTLDPLWFQSLLSNSSTSPYVDFVSYHNYVGNKADVSAAWDTYNGHTPLYQLTQNSTTGPAAIYAQVAKQVAAGKQPLGAATPIYVDEFNTNWVFAKDCCRNDPTYAPLWNALYVSDLLDTVYSGTPRVPGQLMYFSANTNPYFCLIGEWNASMNCKLYGSSVPTAYPQYYAYQLMAAPQYLSLNSGGFMASSVAPAASGGGLVTTAFYTAKQDSILIVNPTGKSYSQLVSARNTGFSSPVAYLYQVKDGRSISHSSLALTPSGSAQNMMVTIPPYSVLGIAIQRP